MRDLSGGRARLAYRSEPPCRHSPETGLPRRGDDLFASAWLVAVWGSQLSIILTFWDKWCPGSSGDHLPAAVAFRVTLRAGGRYANAEVRS